ncbi:substrate-binding domain-containing protein [Aeromicrobium sp.]|uniref:substrate-binding domain-containing protein n=1 Tax=Aeromicrobium sp. TaxID=1871063 RepID=UPI0019B38D2E|nr:substrate-binding domain-containing protein [Aeromicrobium sp.]MBC7631458.1 substrate-binding domain-containing protein [Aeromicrobium sp.]
MRRTKAIASGLTALALLLTSCGGSGTESTAIADESGIAAAEEYLASVSGNPDGIGIDIPLSKTPETGKYIILLLTGEPVAKAKSDAMAAAADALGWRYETIAVGATAEGPQQAMQSAIAKNPDGIHFSGFPSAAFGGAIAAAEEAGIPLLADSITEDKSGPIISTALDNGTQVANWGKMVAAQFIVDSKGVGQGATFTMSEYPNLVVWQESLAETVAEWCPACELTAVATPASDIGTKMPGSVVSTVQRDTGIEYAMSSIGDQTLGLAPALQAAGLSETNVLGETPSEANIEAIRAGTENGWTGFPTIILGWRVMDMWARYFNGDDLAEAEKALLPLQMITQDNLDDVSLTEEGNYYVGFADYADQFKALWKVS